MRELKNIFPPKTKVSFGDDVIEIKSVTFQDLAVVAEIAEKVFDKIFSLLMSEKQDQELGVAIAKELISILKNDISLLQKLLTITTTVKPDVIPQISPEATLFLLDEVLEVNKSFLFQNVIPMAKEIFNKHKSKDPKTNG